MRMMSTKDAAKELGIDEQTVRKAIHRGRLTGQKFGHSFVVVEDDRFRNFKLGPGGRPTWKSERAKQETNEAKGTEAKAQKVRKEGK